MWFKRKFASVAAVLGSVGGGALIGFAAPAFAQVAEPWQMGLQPAATPVMQGIHDLHNQLLVIITGIVILVLALLVYVLWRFNERANPTPSRTSHNTLIEVTWTVVPVLILVLIAIPSFRLLYYMDRTETPDMTLVVTGHQWYWSYEYPDHNNIAFDSIMVPDEQLEPGQLRLLEVDNRVVVPVDTNIRLLLTAVDVIHSWAIPAFGIKTDTIPGRMNETWMRIERPGVYYGQCSELCGINHAFMPIAVEAVTQEEFEKWVESMTAAASKKPANPVEVAQSAEDAAISNRAVERGQ